jgi:hypothetical protein
VPASSSSRQQSRGGELRPVSGEGVTGGGGDDAGKHSHHQAHPPVPVAWPAVACGPLAAGAADTAAAETAEARLRRSAPTTKRCGSTRRLTRTQLRLQFMARWPKVAWPRWLTWSLFVGHGGVRGRSFCGGDGSGERAHGARHDEAAPVSPMVEQKKGTEWLVRWRPWSSTRPVMATAAAFAREGAKRSQGRGQERERGHERVEGRSPHCD